MKGISIYLVAQVDMFRGGGCCKICMHYESVLEASEWLKMRINAQAQPLARRVAVLR